MAKSINTLFVAAVVVASLVSIADAQLPTMGKQEKSMQQVFKTCPKIIGNYCFNTTDASNNFTTTICNDPNVIGSPLASLPVLKIFGVGNKCDKPPKGKKAKKQFKKVLRPRKFLKIFKKYLMFHGGCKGQCCLLKDGPQAIQINGVWYRTKAVAVYCRCNSRKSCYVYPPFKDVKGSCMVKGTSIPICFRDQSVTPTKRVKAEVVFQTGCYCPCETISEAGEGDAAIEAALDAKEAGQAEAAETEAADE